MKLSIFLIINFMFSSCMAMSGKPSMKPQLSRERKDEDKLWRPCQDFEVNNTETRNPTGKLCSRKKGVSKIKDFCSANDFLFFRSGTFVFIDEDSL